MQRVDSVVKLWNANSIAKEKLLYHGNLERGINSFISAASGALMLPVAKAIGHVLRYVLPLFNGRWNINCSVAGEVANITRY